MTKNGQLSWGDFSASLKWATGMVFFIIMGGTGSMLIMTGAKFSEFVEIKNQVQFLKDTSVSREKLSDTIHPFQIQINELQKSVEDIKKSQEKTNDGVMEILKRLPK